MVLLISASTLAIGLFNICKTHTGVTVSVADLETFEEWSKQYGKTYSSERELTYRRRTFTYNVATINRHNSNESKTFTMGLNQFADLTPEEFKYQFTLGTGYNPRSSLKKPSNLDHIKVTASELDWVSKGAVTPVKDQGSCRSSWALGATGAVEGLYYVKKGQLLTFSAQQLLDCSWDEGNLGCWGGQPLYSYPLIKSTGLMLEKDYPYRTKSSHTCLTDDSKIQYKITGYERIAKNDNDALLKALSVQPVSIGVDAGKLQFYSSGILGEECGQDLDHSVLLVGYGQTESGKLFWKIKNSWAKTWGEDGYFRVERKTGLDESPCGVPVHAEYPVDTA